MGVLGGIALCAQNARNAIGVLYGLSHASPLVLIWLLPLALSLWLLRKGFLVLRRERGSRGLLLFVGYTILLLAVNESVLPATPLKGWYTRRALKSVEVLTIHDEIVTTATGDPVGLRLILEFRFPKRTVARVSASALVASEKEETFHPFELEFHGHQDTLKPSAASEGIYQVFEKNVVYRLEITRTPGFRAVDYRTGRPCLDAPPTWSDDQITAALRRRGNRHYRAEITASGDGDNIHLTDYQTSRPYDLEAMYRIARQEKLEPCRH